MVQINFGTREISCKIVYYGPGLSGKTTNLQMIHDKSPSVNRGDLTSIATEGDRTLFFDFLPLELGTVRGMKAKFQLYTVPGQVKYNATRKLVLAGADAIVFVADSQKGKMPENLDSLRNLEDNLREHGKDIRHMPLVLQYNKRDLADIEPVEEMNRQLNTLGATYFESVAISGEGVFPTLKKVLKLAMAELEKEVAPAAGKPVMAGGAATGGAPASDAGAGPGASPTPGASDAAKAPDAPAETAPAASARPAPNGVTGASRKALPAWVLGVLVAAVVGLIGLVLWLLGLFPTGS